jgi:hypothetical protein
VTHSLTPGTHVILVDRFETRERNVLKSDMYIILKGSIVWSSDPERPPGTLVEYIWAMSNQSSVSRLKSLIHLIADVLGIRDQFGFILEGQPLVDFCEKLVRGNEWAGKIALRVNVAGIPSRFPGTATWDRLSDDDLFTAAERLGTETLDLALAEYWMGVAHQTLAKMKAGPR